MEAALKIAHYCDQCGIRLLPNSGAHDCPGAPTDPSRNPALSFRFDIPNTAEGRREQFQTSLDAIKAATNGADVGAVFFVVAGNNIQSEDGHTCMVTQGVPSVLRIMLQMIINAVPYLLDSAEAVDRRARH